MTAKLASRKLWTLILITVIMVTLNYFGNVTSGDLTQWLTFGYSAFAAGNVASKFAGGNGE